MTGPDVTKLFSPAIKVISELAKPATQDKLMAALKKHYDITPKLTWRQRGRLRKMIGSEDAANALMDQDAAALSEVVAATLREPAGQRSQMIAAGLVNEYPGCVDGAEQAVAMAYQLRGIRYAVDEQGEQLAGIGRTVNALHRLSASDPGRIDPEVLLSGPLDGLHLRTDYQRVADLSSSDPAGAAALLSTLIDRIEEAGYSLLTRRFRRQLADLLAQAGQFERAADEWLPMVEDSLTGGFGNGHVDACNSWAVMATHEDAPPWLAGRRAVVIMLEHNGLGDQRAGAVMQVAIETADAGDPAGSVWLMHAAEACLADGELSVVTEHRQRLLMAAAAAVEPMVAARLRLAVADATGDEQLWNQLLAGTIAGSPGTPSDVAALILARRGRNLFQDGQLDSAVTSYRQAAGRGSQVKNWQDAANWVRSALVALKQTNGIDMEVLSSLSDQESAFDDAGPGTLITAGYDMRGAATDKLLQIGAKKHRARTARLDLRRYLKRAIILGEVNNELDAHNLLAQMYLLVDDADAALDHALAAGEVERAGEAAAKLNSFRDCLAAARSPVPHVRAAGLRAASGQADLIPDDLVAQWVRVALDEAKAMTVTALGRDPYVHAYDVLRGLANRIPDDAVGELLDAIAERLTKGYGLLSGQIADILIGLGRHNPDHRARIADLIATTYEDADDIAYDISAAARSLTAPLTMVADRLRALLAPGEYRLGQRAAALTLAVIGDRSPEFVAYAQAKVAEQLPDPDTGLVAGSPGNCDDAALMAAVLPEQRRAELAQYCATQVAAGDADEDTRMTYATACRLAAEGLPAEIRAELFDRMFPQHRPAESQHPHDVIRRELDNPFTFIQMTMHSTERLRRRIATALAVLATDYERQDRLWKATQPLAVSGSRIDANTVGDVAFILAKAGYAAQLPWAAMACSSEFEMRRLAASLIPFTPDVDPELVTNMATDPHPWVRRELAQAIVNVGKNVSGNELPRQQQWIDPVVETLRGDASYRVREIVARLFS